MYNPYQTGFTPYQSQFTQSQASYPQSLIRVTGIDGARAYQMPPNSVAPLFDANRDVLYVKSTDGAGFPTIRAFSFTELNDNPQPSTDYVTREEFDRFKESINAQQPVPATVPDAEPSKPSEKPKSAATL